MDFRWTDYKVTDFTCETCDIPLYRIAPSTLLVCLNPACGFNEPLFLVVADD